jgi:hypothetical protein
MQTILLYIFQTTSVKLVEVLDKKQRINDFLHPFSVLFSAEKKGTLSYAMATSRRQPQPNAMTNRAARNMSPAPKPSESDQGRLRRARSVPTSPDRRSSASTAASSSTTACRPSSSFNPRSTASSRSSTSGSASAAHGKTLLHSVPAVVGAKQAAGVMRRRPDKSGGATSVWPHALTTPPGAASASKDPASRAAKSPASNAQKSKLSTRPGAEKKTAPAASPKPRTQKATTGVAGKAQVASSLSRNPIAKRRTGSEISVPAIQRTTSVSVVAAPKAEDQDVELLMEEFDAMDCISTPSIEEHLQERLPDPVDVTTYATSEHALSGCQVITEHMYPEVVANGAVGETQLKEAELVEPAGETEFKGDVDEPKLNEADYETESKQADSETELKDTELAVNEEAKASEEPETKTPETVQRWRKDDGRSNEVAEEGRSKATTMQERRNKVMALVGRFETAMSGRE